MVLDYSTRKSSQNASNHAITNIAINLTIPSFTQQNDHILYNLFINGHPHASVRYSQFAFITFCSLFCLQKYVGPVAVYRLVRNN